MWSREKHNQHTGQPTTLLIQMTHRRTCQGLLELRSFNFRAALATIKDRRFKRFDCQKKKKKKISSSELSFILGDIGLGVGPVQEFTLIHSNNRSSSSGTSSSMSENSVLANDYFTLYSTLHKILLTYLLSSKIGENCNRRQEPNMCSAEVQNPWVFWIYFYAGPL